MLTNTLADEQKGYDRNDRSRSPRPEPRDNGDSRRSASPNGRDRMDDR